MTLVPDHPVISVNVLSEALGASVVSVERANRSGNSKVFRVRCESGDEYAVKFYFQRTVTGLDRMQVESSALSFMWGAGIRCVPQLLKTDQKRQLAVFEFIHGADVASAAITAPDVEQAVQFASRLKRASLTTEAANQPPASEAAFSIDGVAATIDLRLRRLTAVGKTDPPSEQLFDFLRTEFVPALDTVRQWVRQRIGEEGFTRELAEQARTLSPSDFGFHNALRRANGDLVFLDFEYFGWDDPAKLIVDFVLHPAMDLSTDTKRLFVRRMLDCFADDPTVCERLQTLYPFIALKWCMIMLNEFIPSNLERRRFAGASLDDDSLRMRQLQKSRAMLRQTISKLNEGGFAHV